MSNSQNSSNFKQLAQQAKQLNAEQKLLFIKEFAHMLSPSQLEAMKIEAELALLLCQMDGTENPEELDEQPSRHFEFKKIKYKYYAYLRWREDGHHKSEYLGPMPFLPNYTYTLSHKKDGNKKTFTSLGLEIEDDKIYLKVQVLNPIQTIRSYPYPECLKTIFSKKEWTIEKVVTTESKKEETYNNSLVNQKETSVLPIQPTVRKAGKPKSLPDSLKLEQKDNLENAKDKGILSVKVPNKLLPKVLATLKLWEDLSQCLNETHHWILIRQENQVILRTTVGNHTVIEYNEVLESLISPHPAPVLIKWLQQIADAVSSSSLGSSDTKAQAVRLKTRLQGTLEANTTELLARLFGLPRVSIEK